MKETFICDVCHTEHPIDQQTLFDEQALCPACLEEETTLCDHCGERIWRDDAQGNDNTTLCTRCYDYEYTTCERCGALIRNSEAYYSDDNEDEPYCYECYENERHDRSIEDYCYKPEPIFYGDGARYFGVELEIDGVGETDNHAKRILAEGNHLEEHIYCKHDGSLDDGFEIVTHPMTLDYHTNQMPWPGILHEAIAMGYTSHQAKTCGLHIHVNRNTFGATEQEQDAPIARVLYFFEKHWEELLKFSRRTEYQLKRWAARYGYKDQPKEILDHAKKGYGGGRYTCVNLTNYDTVEFRMFRGTLKLNTLIATLQLVNQICDVAISLSDEEMTALSWTSFVEMVHQPELIQYLKERRLYINEAVESEVEI